MSSKSPLVDDIPRPTFLSPRAQLARHLILLGDQIRLRARPQVLQRLGTIQSHSFQVQLTELAYRYDRLSR